MPSSTPRRIVAPAILGLAFLAFSMPKTPRLIGNATASAPIGFYALSRLKSVIHGDFVLAMPPRAAQVLAAKRGYLPLGVPLVKRIAALSGDRICSDGIRIAINDRIVATRRDTDRSGRPLPVWRGCRILGKTDVFLLMDDVPNSFDGRYFGPIKRSDVLGKLVPLWIR